MAADKTNNLSVFLTDIADQIRANDGTTASINPQDFRTKISNTVGANVTKPTGLSETSDTDTATALSYGTKYKLPIGYYASAKYYSVPADRYQTGYDAGVTAGQSTGKTAYEPKSATITNAGVLTVNNAAGTSIYTATLTPNYNGGYSAAQTEFEPKSATLSNAGVLSVKNSGGTQKYTTTFTNSYDAGNTAGQATGKTNYEPKSYTLSDAGALVVKNSAGTQVFSATVTNSYSSGYSAGYASGKSDWSPASVNVARDGSFAVYDSTGNTELLTGTTENSYNAGVASVTITTLGYTSETSLDGSLSGTTYTVSTPQTKGAHTTKLTKDVTPATLGLTAKSSLSKSGGTVSIDANSYCTTKLTATVSESDLGYTSETSLSGSLSGTTYTVSTQQAKGCHTTKLTKDVTPATLGLTAKAAETIIPGTSDKTIAQSVYTTGIQTIKGDANLLASNIKSGVTIFNVQGTYSGESVSLTGDASEENVRSGKTFYSNSTTKKTGTMPDSDIASSPYIIIDESWDYGIDITRGYTGYHSIKGFNVPQGATMYVGDMGQNSNLYVYGGDGDLYIGDGDDDYEDYVRVIKSGEIVWSNFNVNQYAPGTRKDTITPGTSNMYVYVTSGVKSSDEYIQINGDSNLKSANIKEGVSIFGVSGSLATGIGTKAETASFSKGSYAYLTCAVVSSTTTVPCQVSFNSGYNSTSYYNRVSTVTKTASGSDPSYATTAVGRFIQTSASNVTTYPKCIMIFNNVLAGDKIFFKSMSTSSSSSSSVSYGTEAYITVGTGITAQTNMRSGYLTVMVVISFLTYATCTLTSYIL